MQIRAPLRVTCYYWIDSYSQADTKYSVDKSMNGFLPRAELWLQAAEAHHRDLQPWGPRVSACWSERSWRQQWRAQRRTQGGAQTPAQPAQGRYLRERWVFPLGPWSLFILLNGGKLFNDSSVALTVSLKCERHGRIRNHLIGKKHKR